ncbi:MAG: molybdopterin-guanine dinucleotide biosynthesis protein B [Clostridiales Family XIII bacterium]|jgi:molybdopterin-guanine dinucleotide biosynthesis protein B|nr:molybdopterin-guanine dinucleotide biosynthesis protein B [Clostridiales Family XIII bacterium]
MNTESKQIEKIDPIVIAVCGTKNTGKTTLIEGVIPLLADAGIRTAVIKHHGHELDPDVPGTDTYRFYHVGAVGTIITDDQQFALVKRGKNDVPTLIPYFQDADLIILEGYKQSVYPRIEMLRGGGLPESDPELLIGIVGDKPDLYDENSEILVLAFGDFAAAARLILNFCDLIRGKA